MTGYSLVSRGFQPKFTPKLIQSSQNSISQADPKIQKDNEAEYKKMKAKLALLEANPSTSLNPKTFQPKNKCLVVETFDWDEEKVSDDEEVTQVKVLMALADDELTIGKNHARNGEWIDITMRKRILYCMICKREDYKTPDHEMYIVSLKRSENYKARPYQYASPSKKILKAKSKPFPPCTHYGFNDHRPNDCRNYPECEIYRSYDHFTSDIIVSFISKEEY
nr:retrovirus-related Pol polyprotein from transposon TNT 1-94 [Tanacetum cinerariifolium]